MLATKYYYKDGSVLEHYYDDKILHRVDGPAVEWSNGYKAWRVDGKLHRIDGPAVEFADGGKFWHIDDKLHRLDGPAVEHSDGNKYWWVDDKNLTEVEFNNHPKVQNYRFQLLLEEVLDAGN